MSLQYSDFSVEIVFCLFEVRPSTMNDSFFEIDEACEARMLLNRKPGSQNALVNQV